MKTEMTIEAAMIELNRLKTTERMDIIGCLIEKRGDPHNHQTTA